MGFNDSNAMFTMPVAPTGYGYGNGGFGGFGGDGAWWLLVLLFAMGGWNGGWGANNGGGIPYAMNANTDNAVQRGFDQSAVMNGINNLNTVVGNGFADTQQAICNSTAGITGAINNGFASAEISNNARQMSNMNQMFGLQTQLAQASADNRLATAGLTSTVLSENCQDRYEAAQNTQAIINAINTGVQSLKDDFCKDRLDAKDAIIADLRQQVTYGQMKEGFASEVDALYNRLNNCPVSTVPVYGKQPIFSCGNNSGCGCNGGF